MQIPEETLLTLRDLAKNTKVEVCGVIDSNYTIHTVKNVSNTPVTSFIFDKREYFSAIKQIMAEQKTILCVFHTHPGGCHNPSKQDLEAYHRFKRNSLIVSATGYTWLEYTGDLNA